MKKFLLKSALFLGLLLLLDVAAGAVFSYMSHHARGGAYQRYNYITQETTDDILIFGSSRAMHHYNPRILTDSLGLTCYNCGQDGNGIILAYGWWQTIRQRHRPRIIIYEVTSGYDALECDNHQFLGWLKEVYDRDGIAEIFDDVDPTERWKMLSHLYRYNSKVHQLVADFVAPVHDVSNGFVPQYGELDPLLLRHAADREGAPQTYRFDSLKIAYLNRLIDETSDIHLVFVVSPVWYGSNPAPLAPIRNLCRERGVPFIDFSGNPKYVHRNEYFKDGNHLNAVGADEFSRDLASELKALGLSDGVRPQ